MLSETVVLFPFVLEDALSEITGNADIRSVASARNDIGEICLFQNGSKSKCFAPLML